MFTQFYNLLKRFGNLYPRLVTKREFQRRTHPEFNERPVEYKFVFTHLAHIYPTTILDVGTGISSLPHLMQLSGFVVTAIDNMRDYWPAGMFNRHYYVQQADVRTLDFEEPFDCITCISTLEHIQDATRAVECMVRHLPLGGYLLLTFPYSEHQYIPDVYQLPNASYGQESSIICQSFSREEVQRWCETFGAKILKQEYWQFWTGEFWTCGEIVIPPREVAPSDPHQLTCLLLQKVQEL